MITLEMTIQLLTAMCACEDDVKVVCPMCRIKEFVESMDTKSVASNDLRIQNKAMKESHFIHMEALNNYYHIIHKHCPCKSEGVCESPWLNRVRTK